MSTGIEYDEAWSRRVETIYLTPDVVAQRAAALRALEPRAGERVFDVGSGPGLLAREIALAVGATGAVRGVDVSGSMVAMSQRRCADLPWVDLRVGDATALPCGDGEFDAAVSTQVYEYVQDLDAALGELARALRPGGRAVIIDTDWDSLVWSTDDLPRMRRVLAAFEAHCAHPHLASALAPRLRAAGFAVEHQSVFPLFNPRLHAGTYSHGLIDFVASFVSGKSDADGEETKVWAAELRRLGAEDRYFFSLNRYLFRVRKPVA
jgi:ubiquinone/menaquinone biosynthesis C-methylase UbiE